MKEACEDPISPLRLIQLLQLKLLLDLRDVCKKLSIDYYLIAGSLLGAVRHGGFIPWDSDADVALLRKDYEVLAKNANLFKETVFLQSDYTDVKNQTGFAKLRLKHTIFLEKGNEFSNRNNQGLYIDIFPLDKNIKRSRYSNYFIHYLYKYLVRLKAYKNGKIVSSSLSKSIVSNIICLPSIFIPLRVLLALQNSICQRDSNKVSQHVNNYNSKYGLEKQYMHLDTYLPPAVVTFEGFSFSAPSKIDEWLNNIYGDYMMLPKKQLNFTHELMKNYNIDFGPYGYLLDLPEERVLSELKLKKND